MAVIYKHLKPCGEVFYIGIGQEEKRAKSKSDRNNYWHNVVNKYGYEVQILKSDLTWEDACEMEKVLISWFGRRDLGLGTLVNLTDGGEGNVGWVASDETRARMSKSKKEKLSHNYGKKASKEAKEKMSISATGRLKSEESKEKNRIASANVSEETKFKRYLKNKGKKRTFEQAKRISDAKTDKITKNSIIILDILTGVFYISLAQVCRIYDIPRGQLLGKLKGRSINDTNLIIV